jgi:protein-tyrosine-phosphatase
MAHGALSEIERFHEMTHARLAIGLSLNQAQDAEASRISQRLQRCGQLLRVLGRERLRQERRARGRDDGDGLHARILTHINDGGMIAALMSVDAAKEAPEVLFVCVHNAGRSQMAAGLVKLRSEGRVHVRSAGSAPGDEINPAVVEAMTEIGVDMSEEFPKPLTDEVVRAADVVITMGCGDACPIYPGKKYEDWALEDPDGKDLATVRRIRDEIDERVQHLISELS